MNGAIYIQGCLSAGYPAPFPSAGSGQAPLLAFPQGGQGWSSPPVGES